MQGVVQTVDPIWLAWQFKVLKEENQMKIRLILPAWLIRKILKTTVDINLKVLFKTEWKWSSCGNLQQVLQGKLVLFCPFCPQWSICYQPLTVFSFLQKWLILFLLILLHSETACTSWFFFVCVMHTHASFIQIYLLSITWAISPKLLCLNNFISSFYLKWIIQVVQFAKEVHIFLSLPKLTN